MKYDRNKLLTFKQFSSSGKESNSPPLEGCQPKADGVVRRGGLTGGIMRATQKYKSLPYNPALRVRAKELRKAGILHEALFWNQIKTGKLNGLDFDRQKIIGNYIVDFYCAETNAVIEIDGSSHDGKEYYDKQRDDFLISLSLTVIHIGVADVLSNMEGVFAFLKNHPALTGTPPREGNGNHPAQDENGI